MSEGFTCRGCGNLFLQDPKCVTCGAQKLYDLTVKMQGKQIETQAAEITRLRAELATARREGMEEAAQRLDELHKNHGYNSRTGKVHHGGKLVECPLTIEHSIGYYRALTEGTAHIRAAAGEEKP